MSSSVVVGELAKMQRIKLAKERAELRERIVIAMISGGCVDYDGADQIVDTLTARYLAEAGIKPVL